MPPAGLAHGPAAIPPKDAQRGFPSQWELGLPVPPLATFTPCPGDSPTLLPADLEGFDAIPLLARWAAAHPLHVLRPAHLADVHLEKKKKSAPSKDGYIRRCKRGRTVGANYTAVVGVREIGTAGCVALA